MLFAEPGDYSVTTVLGSCVSVCLWDPASRTGGINHYLLPLWNGDGLRTPKYGNIAIPMLVEKLLEAGCARGNLKAKIFGGASVLEGSSAVLNVGERNIHFAESALEEARIPVIGKDVGGTSGRKLLFVTGTGDVYVRKLNKK
ncbi:MAG: chemotaxis protein CheD [Deltaproteobacteria bacterium]|nr:chemotaxis protein CheD [Deltaproteobacteria bacterium]